MSHWALAISCSFFKDHFQRIFQSFPGVWLQPVFHRFVMESFLHPSFGYWMMRGIIWGYALVVCSKWIRRAWSTLKRINTLLAVWPKWKTEKHPSLSCYLRYNAFGVSFPSKPDFFVKLWKWLKLPKRSKWPSKRNERTEMTNATKTTIMIRLGT